MMTAFRSVMNRFDLIMGFVSVMGGLILWTVRVSKCSHWLGVDMEALLLAVLTLVRNPKILESAHLQVLAIVQGNAFPSDEWCGMPWEEHEEALMLEAAMFGVIPEDYGYHYTYGPRPYMQSDSNKSIRALRPPSPDLVATRLLRQQQDEEFQAAFKADKEKELKATEEAEAARQAALEEQRRKDEEAQRNFFFKKGNPERFPRLVSPCCGTTY
ncbi:Plant UBX domain-containing protein [Drosera capensis]